MTATPVSRTLRPTPPIATTTLAQASAWTSSSCAMRSATALASRVALASTSCEASWANTVVEVYSLTMRSDQKARARATARGS